MLYSIRINQKAIIDSGMDLDITDSSIICWFNEFKGLHTTLTKHDDEYCYYWVSYKYLIKEFPLLRLKTSDSVYRRIKKLIELEILVPHSDNQKSNKTFFRTGDKFIGLFYSKEGEKQVGSKSEVSGKPTDTHPKTSGVSSEVPTDSHPNIYKDDHSTIDHNTINPLKKWVTVV